MADTLKYKTVTLTTGRTTVNSGLPLSQIIKVSRQGEQKDYAGFVSISTLTGNNWTFISRFKRIVFSTSFPAISDETIMIIYKETI